jgi:hypothetical protein
MHELSSTYHLLRIFEDGWYLNEIELEITIKTSEADTDEEKCTRNPLMKTSQSHIVTDRYNKNTTNILN